MWLFVGELTVVALLALRAVTTHVAESTARVALLCSAAVAIAAAVPTSTVASTHAAHAASALWAVAGNVTEAAALVALLTCGSLLSGAVLGHMAWLVAAVAHALSVAARSGVARLRAVAREMASLLAVVADWIVARRAVTRLVTGLSA